MGAIYAFVRSMDECQSQGSACNTRTWLLCGQTLLSNPVQADKACV